MMFSIQTFLTLLAPVGGALASLQSPAFKLATSSSYPANPTLDNMPLTAFSYHPGGFYDAILGSGTPLIGYLNGTDTANPVTGLTLEFINVPGEEGQPLGFSFDPAAAGAPYSTVQLIPGPGNKGMNLEGGRLMYDGVGSAPGVFFGEIPFADTVLRDG